MLILRKPWFLLFIKTLDTGVSFLLRAIPLSSTSYPLPLNGQNKNPTHNLNGNVDIMKPKIYIHTRVEKELKRLEDQESIPGFAARKAHQIICSLAGGEAPINAGKLSRKGDARIRNCLKYDLGKGHRLVCIKEKETIYVLYTGNHDSCNTWMDKHRRLKVESIMEQMAPLGGTAFPARAITSPHGPTTSAVSMERPGDENEVNESDFFPEISQKDLRNIFSGIVNAMS